MTPDAPREETRERPILFSGPMVRAILDGKKTQTRRVVKPQPQAIPDDVEKDRKTPPERQYWWPSHAARSMVELSFMSCLCPHGTVGERLWVRETHYVWSAGSRDGTGAEIRYRATDPNCPCSWTPSIFMRRWASRLTLEITDVRVERVQDISESDAVAEGVDAVSLSDVPRQATTSRRADYRQLWDSLNAKRGYSWESNPWVWVIAFRPGAA